MPFYQPPDEISVPNQCPNVEEEKTGKRTFAQPRAAKAVKYNVQWRLGYSAIPRDGYEQEAEVTVHAWIQEPLVVPWHLSYKVEIFLYLYLRRQTPKHLS